MNCAVFLLFCVFWCTGYQHDISINSDHSFKNSYRQQSNSNDILTKKEYNRLRKELKKEIQNEKRRQNDIKKSQRYTENLEELRQSQEQLARESERMIHRGPSNHSPAHSPAFSVNESSSQQQNFQKEFNGFNQNLVHISKSDDKSEKIISGDDNILPTRVYFENVHPYYAVMYELGIFEETLSGEKVY